MIIPAENKVTESLKNKETIYIQFNDKTKYQKSSLTFIWKLKKVKDCRLKDCRLKECRLKDCRLKECRLKDCRLKDCRLKDFRLKDT